MNNTDLSGNGRDDYTIQEFSNNYSQKLGCLDNSFIEYISDFLIVAHPRTGKKICKGR